MRNTVIASIPSVPLMSLPNGCVIRRRLRGFEVWERTSVSITRFPSIHQEMELQMSSIWARLI